MEKNNELPESWEETSIGVVCDVVSGIGFPKIHQGKKQGKFPVYKVGDISKTVQKGKLWLDVSDNYISENTCALLKGKPFPMGTVVFAKIGEALKLNRRALVSHDSLFDNNVMGLIPKNVVESLYLFYFFNTIKLENISRATTVPSIRKGDVEIILFPLPPINEQKRIIERIEAFFSKIDFQIEINKQTDNLLKSNKKAILRDGFNGKLTQTWREKHTPSNPNLLLNKIENERKNKNLEKFEISSNSNSKNNWSSSTLGFVTENLDGKRIPISKIKRKEMQGKFPYYGASGIIDYVNKPLFKGKYLLIGEDGANLLSRSTPIAFLADGEFWVNNHAHILRPLGEIPFEYLSFFINSIDLSEWVTGTAQPKLNQRNMNKIPLPIPSIEEQIEIVKIIQQNLSLIDKQTEMLKIWSAKLFTLKISILKQAFEGKLVPQDPNDEPSSELLKRVKSNLDVKS